MNDMYGINEIAQIFYYAPLGLIGPHDNFSRALPFANPYRPFGALGITIFTALVIRSI